MNNLQRHILYICMLVWLAAPAAASAATLTFSADPLSIGTGDTVQVTVAVDSDVPLNAFSGTLHYSADALVPIGVSDGNSIINLWVTAPLGTKGEMPFAGLTPGGFAGRHGKLFSIVFKATAPGPAEVSVSGVQFLRNDGRGTPEQTTNEPLELSISSAPHGSFVEQEDTTLPESFQIYSANSPDGQHYIAFSAVDKGSGVDRYEVAEYRWPFSSRTFSPAHAPYLVADQYLTSTIVVRAIDRAGNIRTSVFPQTYPLRPYEWALLCGMILLVALALRRRTHS